MDMITLAAARNYTDSQRLAYEEKNIERVFEFTLPSDQPNGIFRITEDFDNRLFQVGIKYIVTVNGTKYEIMVEDVYVGDGIYDARLLKPSTGNGDYYIDMNIAYMDGQTIYVVTEITYRDLTGHIQSFDKQITIEAELPTIKTIEPKYIPGAVLPVLTIENIEGRALTTKEAEFMNAVLAAKTPFILKCSNASEELCCVMNYSYRSGTHSYGHNVPTAERCAGAVVIYSYDGNTWTIMYDIHGAA